jgi:hypothetical protein
MLWIDGKEESISSELGADDSRASGSAMVLVRNARQLLLRGRASIECCPHPLGQEA